MRIATGLVLIAVVAAFGCVITTRHTIDAHVTVDIRHIKEQAGDVLDFIEGERDTVPELEVDENAGAQSLLNHCVDFICLTRTVHAAELETSSSLAKQILERLRERYPQIEALKEKGSLGENNRGYVELRAADKFEDAEQKNEAQRLIAEENKDRKALYKEIVRLNADEADVSMTEIERVYAFERLKRAESGDLFQLPEAGEYFEEFKKSKPGRKLGSDCKPGAWVEIE